MEDLAFWMLIIGHFLLCNPSPGPGLLCHRPAGALCAASPRRVWCWHRSGQLPEVRGTPLLRRTTCCFFCCQRQLGPDDAWQNGWSHQVRNADLIVLPHRSKVMEKMPTATLISGMQLVKKCTVWHCRPGSSTSAETKQPATFALHRYALGLLFIYLLVNELSERETEVRCQGGMLDCCFKVVFLLYESFSSLLTHNVFFLGSAGQHGCYVHTLSRSTGT